MTTQHERTDQPSVPIAIVGIGCIFPKARNLHEYWHNLKEGVDAITEIPETHWNPDEYFDSDPKSPDRTYAKYGGFLPPIDFNPLEFGILPNALEAIDTSQLLGLLAAREALKDAGYFDRDFDRERASVILGVTGTLELVIPLGARLGHPIWRKALQDAGLDETITEDVVERISASYVEWQENSFPGLLGNVVAGRIANRFDFGGTNCTVDAACASSLSAIHLAAMELANGRADLVLSGGVDTFNHIFMYVCFSKTPALSPLGRARPFDHDCDGTTLGEGVGMLVLKRIEDAVRDGDKVYAVIKGIGSSSDGKDTAIYAPSSKGQVRAFYRAYQQAGVTPDTIELLEAHGTGTKAGDQAEINSMLQVYQAAQTNGAWCALGSVKSQIGHAKSAAGVAGLIKAALALHHNVLPPTINVQQPADDLAPGQSPFYVNTQKRPWLPTAGHPRRAALSSFGFGGTNFHCVLEEYAAAKAAVDWSGQTQILAFAAETPEHLQTAVTAFEPELPWERLRATAGRLRRQFDAAKACRLLLVVERDTSSLPKMLNKAGVMLDKNREQTSWTTPDGVYFGRGPMTGKLGVIFPGQGAQYVGMLRDLACQFPQFQEVLSLADVVFQAGADADNPARLSDLIYPHPTFSEDATQHNAAVLQSTQIAQPAIGAVSLGLLRVLETFGVQPEMVAGHSYGELVALCAAGAFDVETFFALSKLRGRLMGQKSGDTGSMLAVEGDAAFAERFLRAEQLELVIANKNSPQQTVLSGATAEIERAAGILNAREVRCKQLDVAAAFHSAFVADASGAFLDALQEVTIAAPRLPVLADSTAEVYPDDPDAIRRLLAGQLTNPVEFVKIIENMYASGVRTFFEVGPSAQMNGLIKAILNDKPFEAVAVDTSAGKRAGETDLARALAQLAAAGYSVRLTAWDEDAPQPELETSARQKAVTVALSGANYFQPKPPKPPVASRQPPVSKEQAAGSNSQATASRQQPTAPGQQTGRQTEASGSQTTANRQPAAADSRPPAANRPASQSVSAPVDAADALRVTQENLAAFQQFQQQTADLHRQFLEGQDAARQTFERLLTQQQELLRKLGPATPGNEQPPAMQPVSPPEDLSGRAARQSSDTLTPPPVAAAPPEEAVPAAVPADQSAAESADRAEAAIDAAHVEEVLLDVVAEKTGYPVDMLDLDMGLDADLGIDSIKRVEILAALQEHLPHAPQVSSEHLGAIQNLRQIVEFLGANGKGNGNRKAAALPQAQEVDSAAVENTLLQVVAEKTGYPSDMLDLDMGLDADLGIDSIKRVEIFSALQTHLPHAPQIASDRLAQLHTLRQIVDYLAVSAPDAASSTPAPRPAETAPAPAAPETSAPEIALERSLVMPVKLPQPDARPTLTLPTGATIWITEDGTALAPTLAEGLEQRGLTVQRVTPGHLPEVPENLAGLLMLTPPFEKLEADQLAETLLPEAFQVLQTAGASLRAQPSVLLTVSRLDGAFGFGNLSPEGNPVSGGLAGLVKTVRHEWDQVQCKALDIPADTLNAETLASEILDEMFRVGPLEVGLTPEARIMLQLEPSPLEPSPDSQRWTRDDVILITGGARGVTAACAIALAQASQATLVLLGRSPAPTAEPDWLANLTDEAAIKQAILSHASHKMTPKEVKQEYQNIARNREIQQTLDRITAAGARGLYRSVDVRDAVALRAVVEDIQQEVGAITGLIHGAGVLADKKIEDKTRDQFETVYRTKVDGLRNLLTILENTPLQTLVLFSSTTARLGRRGQIDYAAANEVLNKVAQQQARRRPDCRVVAVNWGPWAGGMVTPALEKVFAGEGIGLIPLPNGAEYLLHELALSPAQVAQYGSPEVVVLAPADEGATPAFPQPPSSRAFTVAFERTLDLEHHPFLASHVLNGRAVLPMAVTIEWLGHAALHNNPGLHFCGFNDLRILKGVTLEAGETYPLHVLVGEASKQDGFYVVPVELRGGHATGQQILHARAEFVLATALPSASSGFADFAPQPYPNLNDGLYTDYLFHGPHFQGIERVEGCAADGIVTTVKAAPKPTAWLTQPLRNYWLTDPLIVDGSFQAVILWTFQHYQAGSLPTSIKQYRQFQPKFTSDKSRVVTRVIESTPHRVLANIEFLTPDGELIARMDEYEAVIDPSLNDIFRRNTLSSQ